MYDTDHTVHQCPCHIINLKNIFWTGGLRLVGSESQHEICDMFGDCLGNCLLSSKACLVVHNSFGNMSRAAMRIIALRRKKEMSFLQRGP